MHSPCLLRISDAFTQKIMVANYASFLGNGLFGRTLGLTWKARAGTMLAEVVKSAVFGEAREREHGGAAVSEVVAVVVGSEVVGGTDEMAGVATVGVTDVAILLPWSGTGSPTVLVFGCPLPQLTTLHSGHPVLPPTPLATPHPATHPAYTHSLLPSTLPPPSRNRFGQRCG